MYHTTQIRSPIQTQQPGKQETGSGCHCKSNNDFERSARLHVQQVGQCSSINNIPFPSQSWRLWTGGKKGAITEKDARKARIEFARKHLNDTAGMWRNVLWSVKTKTERFGLNSKCYVWHNLTLHITQSTPSRLSRMVVAASCYGAALHQQGLASLSG